MILLWLFYSRLRRSLIKIRVQVWQADAHHTWTLIFTYLLPLTYANDALRSVMLKGMGFTQIWQPLGALLIFALQW